MARTVNGIKNALRAFGISGKVSIEYVAADRVRVSVNSEYFGLWDSERNTFVD